MSIDREYSANSYRKTASPHHTNCDDESDIIELLEADISPMGYGISSAQWSVDAQPIVAITAVSVVSY